MEKNRSLSTNVKRGQEVQLHDSGLRAGNLIEQSVKSLNSEQRQQLIAEAAKEALRLEVKNTEQNLDYVAGKKAIEDHQDLWTGLDKSGRLTRHEVTSDIKTGAGNMRIESKAGATCFVATVAYGDPAHPDVVYLRSFRDNVLSGFVIGRGFISLYWKIGPVLAAIVKRSRLMTRAAKSSLELLVALMRRLWKDR